MKRPLLLPALLIAAGIMGAELSGGSLRVAAAASVAGWVAALWPRTRTIALGAGFLAVGRLAMLLDQASLAPHDLRRVSGTDPEIVSLHGTILETPTLRLVERKGILAGLFVQPSQPRLSLALAIALADLSLQRFEAAYRANGMQAPRPRLTLPPFAKAISSVPRATASPPTR